ncbi:hypothetical protein EON82_10270 [bacterium]|nr:MAG: hypothetical protein EON82_10270 [bacterium]
MPSGPGQPVQATRRESLLRLLMNRFGLFMAERRGRGDAAGVGADGPRRLDGEAWDWVAGADEGIGAS